AIGILQAWEEPLKLMEAAVVALPDSSDGMLAKTKELRETTVSLVMGLKTILRRTQPGAIEDKFSFRSGWLDLKSPDDNTRNLALYTLARCLRRDTHRIDNYLKVLKCRDVLKNNC
ncbi:prolactin-3B1 precursor, partial [Sigmodon hispidus]